MTKRNPAQCLHPGEFVKDEMEARGWDVNELAKRMSPLGVPVDVAIGIIECQQDIIPDIAFGLSRAFGTSVDLWINLQKAYYSWKSTKQSIANQRNK